MTDRHSKSENTPTRAKDAALDAELDAGLARLAEAPPPLPEGLERRLLAVARDYGDTGQARSGSRAARPWPLRWGGLALPPLFAGAGLAAGLALAQPAPVGAAAGMWESDAALERELDALFASPLADAEADALGETR